MASKVENQLVSAPGILHLLDVERRRQEPEPAWGIHRGRSRGRQNLRDAGILGDEHYACTSAETNKGQPIKAR